MVHISETKQHVLPHIRGRWQYWCITVHERWHKKSKMWKHMDHE